MSKDKIRPLNSAIAGLPVKFTGLTIGIVNALRGPHGPRVAEALERALKQSLVEEETPAPSIEAPSGGRIHIVNVSVNPSRDWHDAINVLPDTGKDWDIQKVGNLYPPQDGDIEDREVILVNFGKTLPNVQPALDWALQYGLTPETPRSVFALCEHKPMLHRELGQRWLAVVSLETCSFGGHRRTPCAGWDGSDRSAGLSWFGKGFFDGCWFAFSRKKVL